MKELVTYIAQNLVNNPDAVQIEEHSRGRNYVDLHMTVDPKDMGRVIGRRGRVINAMRSLVRVAAIKQGKRVNLEIH